MKNDLFTIFHKTMTEEEIRQCHEIEKNKFLYLIKDLSSLYGPNRVSSINVILELDIYKTLIIDKSFCEIYDMRRLELNDNYIRVTITRI